MNKISAYAFCLFVIIVLIVIIINNNTKIKDNFVIEENSCVYKIDNTIDTITIEEIYNYNLIQSILVIYYVYLHRLKYHKFACFYCLYWLQM
uniref:Uncharacterized protein n=1 Tax=Geladintestivirus 5 TaxID=3233137 RepID=A0AAU8MIT9_9CAUD